MEEEPKQTQSKLDLFLITRQDHERMKNDEENLVNDSDEGEDPNYEDDDDDEDD
jgi:hypothetical protein